MKNVLQAATSLVALSGLLYGGVAQATNLAELPLKSSIYIKPNVIIGLDDSGSMNFEVLVKGDQGSVQWKQVSQGVYAFADASGTFIPTGGTDMWWLFPSTIDSPSGVDVFPSPGTWGYAVPPTPQFAAARSNDYHKLYYNPAEKYEPWSPAYVSSLERSYPNVSITLALGAETARSVRAPLQPRALTGAAQELVRTRTFEVVMLRGMAVPGDGTVWLDDGNGNFVQQNSATTITSTSRNARIRYYPATYWKKESCTANGTSCVTYPVGSTSTLKRYEIRPENYPTPEAYKADIQNFANWYTYYRKRTFMLNAAMGKVLESLNGLRMGVVRFNAPSTVTMYDLDSANPAENGRKVAGIFYDITPNGGTPTRENLRYIGEQFKRTSDAAGKPIIQYACQRNNAFVVTDGFYNFNTNYSRSVSSYDKTKWGSGNPYSTTYDDTLANLALHYYTVNPRPPGTTGFPTGKVPEGKEGPNKDRNPDLHMNTYALTLNVHGNMWPAITDPFAQTITWDNPNSVTPLANRSGFEDQPYAIDDLWHATINGRGQMYLATSPTDTAKKISDGFADILSQVGSQGGVALGSVNLTPTSDDNYTYMASYNPSGWSGDLTAHTMNVNTGAVNDNATWSAGAALIARDWTKRIVVADTAGGVVPFVKETVGTIVNPDTVDFPDSGEVVNYLLGKRDGEGTKFRSRTGLLGAVINAEPALDRTNKVVYLATGDGMLHAFDAAPGGGGKELWAMVPRDVLGAPGASPIGATVERSYSFKTLYDATPLITSIGTDGRMLVSGMGAAGRSYFAMDVTNPRVTDAASLSNAVKWYFTHPAMGYTVGKPVAVNTAQHGRVVLVTSGYDNGAAINNQSLGRMWMLNAATGEVIKTFRTRAPSVGEAGLAHVAAFAEFDGNVRYVYGGDLSGALYRFDLEAGGTDIEGSVIAYLKDASGKAQPVTTAPELIKIGSKRVVLVGTGRLLDVTDFGTPSYRNSFYAIADGAELPNARASSLMVNKSYTRGSTVASSTVNTNPVNWATDRGWYMDLPSGEHANTEPVIVYGMVMFVTNVNSGSSCEASSYLYRLDVGTGGVALKDGWVSQLVSNNVGASRVVTLRVVGDKLVAIVHRHDNSASEFDVLPPTNVPGSRNAWREVISPTILGNTPQ